MRFVDGQFAKVDVLQLALNISVNVVQIELYFVNPVFEPAQAAAQLVVDFEHLGFHFAHVFPQLDFEVLVERFLFLVVLVIVLVLRVDVEGQLFDVCIDPDETLAGLLHLFVQFGPQIIDLSFQFVPCSGRVALLDSQFFLNVVQFAVDFDQHLAVGRLVFLELDRLLLDPVEEFDLVAENARVPDDLPHLNVAYQLLAEIVLEVADFVFRLGF